jgi:hypothetical protein
VGLLPQTPTRPAWHNSKWQVSEILVPIRVGHGRYQLAAIPVLGVGISRSQGVCWRCPGHACQRQEARRAPPQGQEPAPRRRRVPVDFGALRLSTGARAHYDRRRVTGDRHTAAQRHLFNRFLGCLYYASRRARPMPKIRPSRQPSQLLLDTLCSWDVLAVPLPAPTVVDAGDMCGAFCPS